MHLKVLKVLQKTKENYYIISEYCNGGKLSDLLKYYHDTNKSQLNEIYIQKIIRQISSGLEYIHSKNIIHQGITLENIAIHFNKYPNEVIKGQMPPKVEYSKITLNDSFTLKIDIIKFSKNLKNAESTNTIIDNPTNMAPEMLSNKSYNNKIDLWSLGVLTYELLTGEKPFLGYNSNDIHNQIMEGKYNLPTTLVASYEIISFINGLLQFYPEKRMDWSQIKKHPFFFFYVDNFNFIELNKIKVIDKNKIEINSKNDDNLLWILSEEKKGLIEEIKKAEDLKKELK